MNKNLTVPENISIKEAMKQLDLTAEKVLLVVDEGGKLRGAISDGDVRRAILAGKKIDDSIENVFNTKPIFLYAGEAGEEAVKKILIEKKIELVPIVDREMRVLDFVTWDAVFRGERTQLTESVEKIDVPVVIMAGGKGTRMEPFTKVLPKPLIPIGEKTIAELIIDQFLACGVKDFYFTLNYKGDMIKAYFNSIERDYNVDYVYEDDFYGTAGCLKLLDDVIKGTFILSNCDILVRANYAKVLEFHRQNESELTVLSAIQHYQIPYGVIRFGKNGAISEIQEKPEHTFTINTGVYFVNRECLDLIPEGKIFHMTDLIEDLMKAGRGVYTYPVNANDYVDIGQWDEYRKTVSRMVV
ncbi:MAG: sugar phosphate nucleotidyltransferase [Spirochaetota bacterium]